MLYIYAGLLPVYAASYFAFRRISEKKLQDVHEQRKRSIGHYLVDLEGVMNKMGDHIKESMNKWIDQKHEEYQKKINGYYGVACCTIQNCQKAYELALSFASKFVLIECQLETNLHLATHGGSAPCIDHEKMLNRGGFFNIYAASWDNEHELVAKKLRERHYRSEFCLFRSSFPSDRDEIQYSTYDTLEIPLCRR